MYLLLAKYNIYMEPFNMLIGMTSCGKTKYVQDMLEKDYKHHFDYILLICPMLDYNNTDQE